MANNGTHQPYVPANPPVAPAGSVELTRAVWDEFYRVGQALAQMDQPVSVIVEAADVVQVQAPGGAWHRLFNANVAFPWEAPRGMLNASTGEWKCRVSGIYHAAFSLVVDAFNEQNLPQPYQLEVRAVHTGEAVNVTKNRSVLCSDAQSGEVSFTLIFLANQGDVMTFDARLSQVAGGTANASAVLTMMRLSGAR